MSDKQITILKDRIDKEFLPFVRRPARYIGGEINQTEKDLSACDVTVALCFPDIYEIAASYSGLAVIYNVINQLDFAAAQRAFAPWLDAEDIMREKNIPLFTLESKASVADFDIIAFSLTNELACTNMLNMLDLAGLELRSAKRSETNPLIIAGGQQSNSAEPISEFVDMFVLGEGEEAIVEIIKLFRKQKAAGKSKQQFLIEAAKTFSFVYVPSLYNFEYDGEKIKSFSPNLPGLPMRFENAVVKDFDNAPVPAAPIVPFVEAVHERVSVEIMRGCPGRCRFCQASFCRRPLRFRSIEKIIEIAKQNYHATGFDTVSLLSLSTADYPNLEELVIKLLEYFQPRHVGISLPSLRVGQQLKLLPKLAASVRKSGLTIAIEAADEKLRKVINKPITDEHLFAAVEAAYQAGFVKLKLYFMIGFEGETERDITQIVDLCNELARLRKKVDNKTANITAAISWLVPKPHTPFGWLGQKQKDYFQDAKDLILKRKRQLGARYLQFKFHNIDRSVLESALARGDRRMADVIETAWRKGAKFELWDECFDYNIWERAFETHGTDLQATACRSFAPDEILPWAHLGGPDKEYLLKHFNDALETAKSTCTENRTKNSGN